MRSRLPLCSLGQRLGGETEAQLWAWCPVGTRPLQRRPAGGRDSLLRHAENGLHSFCFPYSKMAGGGDAQQCLGLDAGAAEGRAGRAAWAAVHWV